MFSIKSSTRLDRYDFPFFVEYSRKCNWITKTLSSCIYGRWTLNWRGDKTSWKRTSKTKKKKKWISFLFDTKTYISIPRDWSFFSNFPLNWPLSTLNFSMNQSNTIKSNFFNVWIQSVVLINLFQFEVILFLYQTDWKYSAINSIFT